MPVNWLDAKRSMKNANQEANRITKLTKAGNKSMDGQRKKAWAQFFDMKNTYADIRPTYSVTVHKSQGSTFEVAFIDLDDISKNSNALEVARLLYVAMTRASKTVYITGNYSAMLERFNK